MMLRELSDRARTEGFRAIQGVLGGVRRPFMRQPANDLYVVRGSKDHSRNEAVWWSRADPDDADNAREPSTRAPTFSDADAEVTKSLDRIAETIDRLAAQLDAYHTELAEHFDAIEFLLREMVLGGAASAASTGRPVVLGGVVDADAMERATPEITIMSEAFPLEVDTPVEVRSRFHDRWICGFAVAEAIDSGAGRCRYRLTRRSDGIPLPILFEACDVRAAESALERQPAD
jgi:hypothetical protein